jgi:hypothetical protein
MENSTASRGPRAALIVFCGALLLGLAACNNTYGPPPADGKPRNAGEAAYLRNQQYQQLNLDRISN